MYAELMRKCLTCNESGKRFYNYEHEKKCTDCMKIRRKESYKANREYVLKRVSRYRKGNPDKIKHTKLKQAYGISFEEYQTMVQKQNGVCVVCERPEKVRWKGRLTKLAVDHDHKTGKVRGLLCQRCNRALGLLDEDRHSVKRLFAYIVKHKN